MANLWRPSDAPRRARPTFAPIVARPEPEPEDDPRDVLTDLEQLRLIADRRLIAGLHCEFLDKRQRDRLAFLCWRIERGDLADA